MSIHLTRSGLSDDSQYLEDVEAPKELTLDELKDQLLDMPSIESLSKDIESNQFIRLREKQSNGFFGRIFREGNKTLKQHGVKDRSSLVIQILDEAEVLGPDDFVLFYSKRDSENRLYTETRQVKLNAKKISDLQMTALQLFGNDDSTVDSMKIVKHVPHQFEWKVLDPNEEVTYKQKKKTIKTRAGDLELKKPPLLLKDGDHIGVLVDGSVVDDFQTDADKDAAEAFRVQKELKAAEKAKEASSAKYGNDSAGIHIKFDDEEERLLQLALEESRKQAQSEGITIDLEDEKKDDAKPTEDKKDQD